MSSSSFVHLHTHTDYSLLDGASQVGPLVEAAAAQGMPALAMTDHGNLFGAFEFYKACREHDINPIIGLEAYMTPGPGPRTAHSPVLFARGGSDDVSARGAYTHMTLWAETTAGMHNLFRFSSESFATGFYRKARGDRALLEQYGQGLIGTTGCPSGEVQTWLRLGNYDKARQAAADYRDILGAQNYFVELMDHGLDIERRVRDDLLRLAADLGLPTVATNDLHYVNEHDHTAHDALLCINSGSQLADPERFRFDSHGYYLRTADEMRLLFSGVDGACDNTLLIAERCRVEFDETANLMPEFDVPAGETEATWFAKEVQTGLARRYPNGIPAASQERADYEVGVVNSMGFPGYYLVVADFIGWAKDQGIRVGPGRGSGAGSIAAYALRITDLDPIEHDLLFERFLNPERVSMPDFDIDFDERRRGEVIDYVTRKYGQDRVAQIVTIGKIKAKAAIKDAVRIHGLPYVLGDQATKAYPPDAAGKSMSLKAVFDPTNDRYDEAAEFRAYADNNPDMKAVLETARGIENITRGTGVHAAGVIMSKARIVDHIPLMTREADGAIITQFENQWCEALGLLKMDFLGLSNLTIIDDAIANIRDNQGIEVDLDALPLDDAPSYATLAAGHGQGVFQLESAGIRSLLRQIAPTEFKHLDATLALYRPGPMGANAHVDYADRKNGRAAVTPIHPELAEPLAEVLGPTYGLIVYQEQVMAIAQILAGYTLGQADLLRRAMGKKKREVLEKEFVPFHDGMRANGYSDEAIDRLWEILVPFTDYAFNKAHTAAYGLITYWTAWLKTHYPVEYLAALLTGAKGDRADTGKYLQEARRLKISVVVPDVNESIGRFTATGDTIRVGLTAISGVGQSAVDALVAEREANGPYTGFEDFMKRVPVTVAKKDIINGLVVAGAFDAFGQPRAALFSIVEQAIATTAGVKKAAAHGQDDLFGDADEAFAGDAHVTIPNVPEWHQKVLLAKERDILGLYVSGHPLAAIAHNIVKLSSTTITDLHATTSPSDVVVAGNIAAIERKVSRKGDAFAIVTLEDLDNSIEVLCFPRTYAIVAEHLALDRVVVITGRAEPSGDGQAKIFADTVTQPVLDENGNRPLYLTCPKALLTAATIARIKALAAANPGPHPLRLKVVGADGVTTNWSIPVLVAYNEAFASEAKELFGLDCLQLAA